MTGGAPRHHLDPLRSDRVQLTTLNASLRLLRAFVAVGREGTVRKAAQRLFVSQPSLSQDIRRLEEQVGVSLFYRGPHGMALTRAGEELLHSAEAAIALLERGVERARQIAATSKPRVVLAFSPSVGNKLMPALLPLLEQQVPDIEIDEREVDTGDVGPGVRDGRFDLGLAHCPSQEEGIAVTPLLQERLYAAIASVHRAARRTDVSLRDLAELDLLLWPRDIAPEYYDAIIGICHQAGLRPEVVQGPRRAMIRSYLLANGRTFCLLPASTAALQVDGVSFVRLVDAHAAIPLTSIKRPAESRVEVLSVETLVREHCAEILTVPKATLP